MAIILITHNLGVVAEMCDEVVVMYLGRVVERGPVDAIFHAPRHPYTQALLRSIPSIQAQVRTKLPTIAGSIPHPYNRPAGCPFHPRCVDCIRGTCERHEPELLPRRWRERRGGELLPVPSAARLGRGAGRRPGRAHERTWPASPRGPSATPATAGRPGRAGSTRPPPPCALLDVRGLRKFFPIRRGLLRRVVGSRPRRGRCELRAPAGRDALARGRERLREDDDLPLHPARDHPHRRRDPLPRRRRPGGGCGDPAQRAAPPAPARDADDLPGPVLVAEPAEDAPRHRGRAAAGQRRRHPARARRPRGRAPPTGRAPARVHAAVPARVQRRPAPAHRHRPGPRAQPEPRGRRRAGLRPRRLGPGPDPEPDAPPPDRARAHVPVRGPRPLRRQARERPGGRHVRGPDRRGRRHGAAVRHAQAPLHRGAALRGAQARPAAPHPAHRAGGRGRGPGEPAAWLLLPPSVLVRRGRPAGPRRRVSRRSRPGTSSPATGLASSRFAASPSSATVPPAGGRAPAARGARDGTACPAAGTGGARRAGARRARPQEPPPPPTVGLPSDDGSGGGALAQRDRTDPGPPARLPAHGRRHRGRGERERDRARRVAERLPRLLRLRGSCGAGVHDGGPGARPPPRLPAPGAPSSGGQHPAEEPCFPQARATARLPEGGLLAALPEGRRALARSRALGDRARGLGAGARRSASPEPREAAQPCPWPPHRHRRSSRCATGTSACSGWARSCRCRAR